MVERKGDSKKNMISKPTYLLYVWHNYDNTCFSIIEDMGLPEARKFYDYHIMFNGQAAVVFVFYNDVDIREYELLDVATQYMKGEYIRIDVDMDTLKTTSSKGVDLTNPRQ